MTSFWQNRSAFIGQEWAHSLILNLHRPTAWPSPSLEHLEPDDRALADRLIEAHRLPTGEIDPEFTSLAQVLEEQTFVFEQEWEP